MTTWVRVRKPRPWGWMLGIAIGLAGVAGVALASVRALRARDDLVALHALPRSRVSQNLRGRGVYRGYLRGPAGRLDATGQPAALWVGFVRARVPGAGGAGTALEPLCVMSEVTGLVLEEGGVRVPVAWVPPQTAFERGPDDAIAAPSPAAPLLLFGAPRFIGETGPPPVLRPPCENPQNRPLDYLQFQITDGTPVQILGCRDEREIRPCGDGFDQLAVTRELSARPRRAFERLEFTVWFIAVFACAWLFYLGLAAREIHATRDRMQAPHARRGGGPP